MDCPLPGFFPLVELDGQNPINVKLTESLSCSIPIGKSSDIQGVNLDNFLFQY
jgi:hypothetical protein